MKIKLAAFFVILFLTFLFTQSVHATILITEILADPPGDVNNDGVISSSQDEFMEILNTSDAEINLTGWSIRDAIGERHAFIANTILSPYAFFVVFGGGAPNLTDIDWQTASTGALGLNNSGDTITLRDFSGEIINSVTYGSEGNNNQSLTRFPEGANSEFVLHSSIPEAQGRLYSPGTTIDGQRVLSSTVPEATTFLYIALGWSMLILKRREKLLTK